MYPRYCRFINVRFVASVTPYRVLPSLLSFSSGSFFFCSFFFPVLTPQRDFRPAKDTRYIFSALVFAASSARGGCDVVILASLLKPDSVCSAADFDGFTSIRNRATYCTPRGEPASVRLNYGFRSLVRNIRCCRRRCCYCCGSAKTDGLFGYAELYTACE